MGYSVKTASVYNLKSLVEPCDENLTQVRNKESRMVQRYLKMNQICHKKTDCAIRTVRTNVFKLQTPVCIHFKIST